MHLPGPLRAAVGLVATAAAEAKHLPDRAIELPMLAVSSALQASLRAQQRYARLAARGDEVLNRRPPTAEPPPWATFDDPVDELRRPVGGDGAAGAPPVGGRSMFDQLFAVEDPTVPVDGREPVDEIPSPDEPPVQAPVARVPAKKTPVRKAPATKTAGTKTAATKTPTKKAPAKKAARNAPAVAPVKAPAKGPISKPRHTAPSAFDNAADDADIATDTAADDTAD